MPLVRVQLGSEKEKCYSAFLSFVYKRLNQYLFFVPKYVFFTLFIEINIFFFRIGCIQGGLIVVERVRL